VDNLVFRAAYPSNTQVLSDFHVAMVIIFIWIATDYWLCIQWLPRVNPQHSPQRRRDTERENSICYFPFTVSTEPTPIPTPTMIFLHCKYF